MALKLNLQGVHVFEREQGSLNYKLSKIFPAMRLATEGQEVYIQHGRYWTAGGDPIKSKDLPVWVADELAKCSPAALAEAGIHVAVKDPEVKKPVEPVEPEPTEEDGVAV